MADSTLTLTEHTDLEAILASYLKAKDQGQALDPEYLMERYPEFKRQLQEFFNDEPHLKSLMAPIRLPNTDPIAFPVLEDYEILEQVGKGGMGVVFRARHKKLKHLVALKMIVPTRVGDANAVTRFQDEARAIAHLGHPGIVHIYEVGAANGLPFFTMEWVDGGSLDRQLNGTPWPAEKAAELLKSLALAVEACHAKDIIHRDLKPGNILMTKEGAPKISDFGLAKQPDASDLTATGVILGTASYMAPEAALGQSKQVGRAADIYSLGAIFYLLLTGRPPHLADTPLETLALVIGQEPIRPHQFQPKLPIDLETICLKCLQKEPAKRYATAAALAEDLQNFQDKKPIRARPIGIMERTWRWCRRQPARAALAAVSCLALFALVALGVGLFVNGKLSDALDETERLRQLQVKATVQELLAKWDAEELRIQINYSRDMMHVHQHWNDSRLPRVRQLLDEWLPTRHEGKDRRGWEWHYFDGLLQRNTLTFQTGMQNTRLSISPDGRWLAVGSEKGQMQIWNLKTMAKTELEDAHAGVLSDLAFRHDSKELASIGWDQWLKVWDPQTGRVIRSWKQADWLRSVRYSPDGNTLAISDGAGRVRLCDASTGNLLCAQAAHSGWCDAVAFLPNGKLATAGRDGVAKLWDLGFGRLTLSRVFRGHALDVASVAISPDGLRLATCGEDATVKLWTVAGELLATLHGHTGMVRQVTFLPDGRHLVSVGFDATVRVWDVLNRRQSQVLRGHLDIVPGVACHPDCRRIFTASRDGTIKVWDLLDSAQEGRYLPEKDTVTSLAFHPDGKKLAMGYMVAPTAFLDLDSQDIARSPKRFQARGVAVSSDGAYLAGVLGETMEIWRLRDNTSQLKKLPGQAGERLTLAFHPKKNLLATGFRDGSVKIIALDDDQPDILLHGHKQPVRCVTFDALGERLMSSAEDAILWDVATGQNVHHFAPAEGFGNHPSVPSAKEGSTGICLSVAISPSGDLAATGDASGHIILWNLATGEAIRRLRGHVNGIYELAFHPGGRRLASASGDLTVKLWDVDSGLEVLTLRGFDNNIYCLKFSPDGTHLAAGGAFSGRLKMFDLAAPKADVSKRGLLAWHLGQSQECARDRDFLAAHVHLKQILEVSSDKPWEKVAPATWGLVMEVAVESKQWDVVALAADRLATEPGPRSPLYFARRGEANARLLKNFQAARDDFLKVAGEDPSNLQLACSIGALHLLADDPAAYEAWVNQVLADAERRSTPRDRTAYLLARLSVLSPSPPLPKEKMIALAQEGLRGAYSASALHTMGLAHLRSGETGKAVSFFESSLKYHAMAKGPVAGSQHVLNHLGLALAHHRAGNVGAARVSWASAQKLIRETEATILTTTPGHWPIDLHDWLAYRLLLREAESYFVGGSALRSAGRT